MKPENDCLTVLDEITGALALSEAGKKHAAACPTCAEIRRTADSMRECGSAYPPEAPAGLKTRILSRFQDSLPPFWEGWFRTFTFAAALGVITAFVAFQGFHPTDVQPGTSQSVYSMSMAGGGSHLVPLDQPVRLGSGETAQLQLPDGSQLTFTGPGNLNPQTRGFLADRGTVEARVTRGEPAFTAATPHCTIEVLGTAFTCVITPESTALKISEGKVRTTSLKGERSEFAAGDEAVFSAPPVFPPDYIEGDLGSPAAEIRTTHPPDED